MKKPLILVLVAVILFLFSMPTFGRIIIADGEIDKKNNSKVEEERNGSSLLENPVKGLGFGFAIAATSYKAKRKSVERAEIINGKIRILEERNTLARLMLESHYFFGKGKTFGYGPFLAIEIIGKQLGTLGAGFMMGWRHNEEAKNSFNVGIGLFNDNNFKELGSGLIEDKEAPQGENMIRYKERNLWGYMIIFSFSFGK